MRTLKELRPGQSGIILNVCGTGSVKKRLIDMGMTPGVKVSVTKIAPLGDPMEIILRGFSLAVRKEDAKNIMLQEDV